MIFRLTLFTSSDLILFSFYFPSARYFQVSATSPAGGARQLFLLFFCFLIYFLFQLVCLFFCFYTFYSYGSLFHTMCMPCQSFPVVWHSITLSTTVLTAYQVRGNVVSLWRSFVTTELLLSSIGKSAQTLVVLDVAEQKEG